MTWLEQAKQAGCDEALNAFGLLHLTNRPPPTWAHGKKVTLPSMSQSPLK